jgi:cytidine deaminase
VKNYDNVNYNHTVGVAIRCKNGNIYIGVNLYLSLGAYEVSVNLNV